MISTTMYCDRCGAEIPIDRWISCNGQRLFRKKYYLRFSTEDEAEVDLCQKCYDSLEKWMKEDKE